MLKPGTYKGRIESAGFTDPQPGKAQQVAVTMACTDDGNLGETMTWFGGMKPGKNVEITIETLIKLGFKGATLTELASGAKMLDTTTEFPFKVADETWTDNSGQSRTTTKIVSIGAGGSLKMMDPLKASTTIPSYTGEIMQARQKLGVTQPKPNGQW